MFMSDVHRTEEIRSIAIQDLRKLGIKYRPKKLKHEAQTDKKSDKIFKQRLQLLPKHVTTLKSGQQLLIPKIVDELCSFILSRAETEGLFRKAGSRTRQKDIVLLLERGGELNEDHHEIDVANVLKTFLRELPEPLIPYSFHDLFLKCIMLKQNQLEAVLLACLLLPVIHLNTLAYIMQFLSNLTEYSVFNRMDAYNLAVVMGPTILPVDEKLVPDTQLRLLKICELTKLIIENANELGFLPEKILVQIEPSSSSSSSSSGDIPIKKKKKRRSGSLTRMFTGLKKYVGSKIGEDIPQTSIVTPDLLLTPCITRSSKKRKVDNSGFSAKKKRELLHSLPQNTLLSTPFTPHRTPISAHPNINKNSELMDSNDKINVLSKEKKYQWCSKSKIIKTTKNEGNCVAHLKSTKTLLERRWSAVHNAANFRKNKKRNSCAAALEHKNKNKQHEGTGAISTESDYVKISKVEYEEIKSRVSEIERRISIELETVKGQGDIGENITDMEVTNNPIEHVQTAYEQTLEQAEPLSPTTDHLARRLSRELKIRRSTDQMIFRSPSARKIGSLKRRSRELERHNAKLNRNYSWHFNNETVANSRLKRGSPNTILTGLPYPIDNFSDRRITRSSSLNNKQVPLKNNEMRFSGSTSSSASQWTSAEGFFQNVSSSNETSKFDNNCRASLVRLRNQNAGMVQAKAKLFNEIISDKSSSDNLQNTLNIPRAKIVNKMGSSRNADKVSHRVRTLKYEDRRLPRKSMSPRKKAAAKKLSKQYAEEVIKNEKTGKENHKCVHTASCDCINRVNLIKSPLKDCNRIDLSDPRMKTLKTAVQLK